ncbi:MAG: biotin-dependent carboxyltransferase family protein [Pseudomonadota bacterium]
MSLKVISVGPACTVQDQGRTGCLDRGLSRSGAADLLALHEGAALLGHNPEVAAIEMAGMGGVFEATADLFFALTGAKMQASIDGGPVAWNASHRLDTGQKLTIGAVLQGNYGYLHVQGGIATEPVLGSRASHLTAGLGRTLATGDTLPVGPQTDVVSQKITAADRFSGGTLRAVKSFQTSLFEPDTLSRFEQTPFRRGARANRMGMQLDSDGPGFAASGQLNILSEVISPGDIQMTGAGAPFILLNEHQTTGGYPRIATIVPCDLPRAAQSPAQAPMRIQLITLEKAVELHAAFRADLTRLPSRVEPLVRDPRDIPDLLSYQLISGVVSAVNGE